MSNREGESKHFFYKEENVKTFAYATLLAPVHHLEHFACSEFFLNIIKNIVNKQLNFNVTLRGTYVTYT